MSTTHPTNITTEWDDIQRKYGNLPKLEKEKTNEELDSAFVEVTEEELLREARLKKWKKKLGNRSVFRYGTPVNITADNFVEQVTDASKYKPSDADKKDDEFEDLYDKTGYYVPVLLLDDSPESKLLKNAWNILSKKHSHLKFTVGSASNVLKVEGNKLTPPSSVLLYFSGNCILQKNVSSLFKRGIFELSEDTLETRVANALENILNSAQGHLPLVRDKDKEESSDSESDTDYLKSSGKDLRTDFLNKLTRGKVSDLETSKTYTSWILDKALGN
uniref:Phosducin thioredoxin-like domain-containing protein n=1 Tax=Theileria annulata TaxID=5874 RepID=A0A3B0N518_THEAN